MVKVSSEQSVHDFMVKVSSEQSVHMLRNGNVTLSIFFSIRLALWSKIGDL
jgi:hypothetical protein